MVIFELVSFAHMTMGRAVQVGRAFDAPPHLRPLRVGGDPARIKVGESMADLIQQQRLPLVWLTVRINDREAFESGEIHLADGRAYGTLIDFDTGEEHPALSPHKVDGDYLEASLKDHLEDFVGLFTDLIAALDACYGYAANTDDWRGRTSVLGELPDVCWLNYFGPAFVDRWPDLTTIGNPLPNGGVLVRTTPDPWQPVVPGHGPFDAPWKAPVLAITGTDAYAQPGPLRRRPLGVYVPPVEAHLAYTPGGSVTPWEDAKDRRDEDKRRRTWERARTRRLKLQAEHGPPPPLSLDAQEWSISFDLADWQDFYTYLRRHLKGDLAGPIGRALTREIEHAPHDTEDNTQLRTTLGTIDLSWFIDDTDVVDPTITGPPQVIILCEKWFENP